MPEGYNLDAQVASVVQDAATPAPHVVHVTPAARNEIHYTTPPSVNAMTFVNHKVYRFVPPPSEIMGFYDQLDDFKDQFNEMQKEMKALQGKYLIGHNVSELYLVPNVKVPTKFKVPKFERYKGNSSSRDHLVMHIWKMYTHTDDQHLLIHFF